MPNKIFNTLNKYLFLLLNIILYWGCQNQEPKLDSSSHNEPEYSDEPSNVPIKSPDSATVDMIQRVQKQVAKIDPNKITYYLNDTRAQNISKKMKSQTGITLVNSELQYAKELLNAGKTEKSIKTYQSILAKIEDMRINDPKEILLAIKRNLAVAYMRKAEQDNCLANHTAESCIIPISKNGQHQLKEGATKTIALLNEILQINPNDQECQYLLNVAHMTLGQYPDKVPERYRIPPEYFHKNADFPMFKDIAMGLGVDMKALSGGTCIDDFNNDGYLDIIASSWGFDHQIRYYENDKNGGFIDKTNSTGLVGVTGGLNLRHADYNNDGQLDFLILRGAWFFEQGKIPNSLIKNNGDGTFTDVSIESGIYSEAPTQTAVWADFNLDGWLDLFLANESKPSKKVSCELLMNQKNGTFVNQTQAAGLNISGFFKGVSCGDVNNDGYPDLYISNLGDYNQLHLNNTKSGILGFVLGPPDLGVSEPQVSFPTWMFDYNNDGYEDIFVSGYSYGKTSAAEMMLDGIAQTSHPMTPYLYRNNGNGTFTNVASQMGLNEPIATMGCNFGDLDNDGFLDFYLATGEPNLFSIVPNRMYRNVSGNNFQDVTYQSGFGHIQKGHAVGFGDLDMDGDQDIYAVMGGAFEGDVFQNILYENPVGNANNWISIQLVGTKSNRSAIGARIILIINENGKPRRIFHTVGTGASFGGNSLLAEIGVGKASIIEKLSVIWPTPGMTTSNFKNVLVNKKMRITEGESEMEILNIPATSFSLKAHQHH